jgi:hypothetical protein
MPQSQFNAVPTYQVPLLIERQTSRDWYFFFTGLFRGLPPENVSIPVAGPSPYIYGAQRKGSLIVTGGTVSLIEFSRDGVDYYDVGQTSGMFALNASDVLRITHAGAPNLVFVPT